MRPILGESGEAHAWTKARSTWGVADLMAQLNRSGIPLRSILRESLMSPGATRRTMFRDADPTGGPVGCQRVQPPAYPRTRAPLPHKLETSRTHATKSPFVYAIASYTTIDHSCQGKSGIWAQTQRRSRAYTTSKLIYRASGGAAGVGRHTAAGLFRSFLGGRPPSSEMETQNNVKTMKMGRMRSLVLLLVLLTVSAAPRTAAQVSARKGLCGPRKRYIQNDAAHNLQNPLARREQGSFFVRASHRLGPPCSLRTTMPAPKSGCWRAQRRRMHPLQRQWCPRHPPPRSGRLQVQRRGLHPPLRSPLRPRFRLSPTHPSRRTAYLSSRNEARGAS